MQDALDDPQEAYAISTHYVEGLAADDPVQQEVLLTSMELWKADRLGETDAQAWENMQNVLLDMGLIESKMDLSKAFTNEFIP